MHELIARPAGTSSTHLELYLQGSCCLPGDRTTTACPEQESLTLPNVPKGQF